MAAIGALAALLAVVTALVWLEGSRIGSERATIEATAAETEGRILDARRAQDAAETALAEAEALRIEAHGLLQAATDRAAASQSDLDAAVEGRTAAEGDLFGSQLDVLAAAESEAANVALITDLDRCLEHATRATNALSVGDFVTAAQAIGAARGPCERVGVVAG